MTEQMRGTRLRLAGRWHCRCRRCRRDGRHNHWCRCGHHNSRGRDGCNGCNGCNGCRSGCRRFGFNRPLTLHHRRLRQTGNRRWRGWRGLHRRRWRRLIGRFRPDMTEQSCSLCAVPQSAGLAAGLTDGCRRQPSQADSDQSEADQQPGSGRANVAGRLRGFMHHQESGFSLVVSRGQAVSLWDNAPIPARLAQSGHAKTSTRLQRDIAPVKK